MAQWFLVVYFYGLKFFLIKYSDHGVLSTKCSRVRHDSDPNLSMKCVFSPKWGFFSVLDHRQSGYKVSVHSTWAKTDILTPLQYWSHYCFTYDNVDNSWVIYQDGEQKAQGKMPPYTGVLEGNGAYIIGRNTLII